MDPVQDPAMATLMNAVSNGAEPQVVEPLPQVQQQPQQGQEPQVVPPVEGQESQPAEGQPQVPMELMALMSGQSKLEQGLTALQEQLTSNQPQTPMSDEEVALQDLAEKLGLSNITNENAQLKQTIETLQQSMQQNQLQNDIASFKAERPNADEMAIVEYISKMPQNMQIAMDNPAGWRMVDDLLSLKAQPHQPPTNDIIPSNSVPGAQSSAFDRMKQGENVSKADMGAAILQAIQNR